jgi:hypothetical protein
MTNQKNAIMYKPAGPLLGAGAGVPAGLIFKQAWKLVDRDDDMPNATDE